MNSPHFSADEDARLQALHALSAEARASTDRETSERGFRALCDSAPIGIFESKPNGRCTYVNPALLEITRRTAEQVLRFGWARILHPDDRLVVRRAWNRAARSGQRWSGEVRLVMPDGTLRWARALAAPTKDAEGRVVGFVGTMDDITQRRVADIAVVESEERYRKLLLLSPDANFVLFENCVALANPAFCRLLGAPSVRELLSKPFLEFVHPDWHAAATEMMRRVLTGTSQSQVELKFLRLDGSPVSVEVAAVSFEFRGRHEVQMIAHDITNRKAAEAALRESEQRFKLVARAVSDVIWDWDVIKNSIWWSDSFQAVFGYSLHELEPGVESWSGRIHSEDRERVLKDVHDFLRSDQSVWTCEYRFRRKDGTYALVQDRGHVMRDASGQPYRMVGGISDHTERKNLEQQFLRAQRMESIGTLAGGIAHDLNNVLAPILMSVDLLKLDAGNNPQQLQLLETVHLSARRGADLVRQVLTFARGVDGQRVAVNLRHVLTELESISRETFPRNILLTVECVSDLWPILGDATQLHQVLLNLAVNARDAMPKGGALTLTAENLITEGESSGSQPIPAGSYVAITVSDTGTGIPPELRERIFEPFFTTKEKGKGTGLGLATVHAVVKGHGGFVHVESEMGRGTTFKIHLPADPGLRAASQPQASAVLPRGRNELILVVDDEASIRSITRHTLESFGYRVLTAQDGAEALGLYARYRTEIALVLTDIMMPVMDGAAMVQVLLRHEPNARIIGASGLNSPEDVIKAASAGVKHFLAKPYSTEAMLKLVRAVLDAPCEISL